MALANNDLLLGVFVYEEYIWRNNKQKNEKLKMENIYTSTRKEEKLKTGNRYIPIVTTDKPKYQKTNSYFFLYFIFFLTI